jgi:cephalosporin-C deacetylase-like acetyl esterase
MNNRRAFLKHAAAISVAPSMFSALPPSGAAAPANGIQPYSTQMPDMLLAYLAGRTNALATGWDRKRAQITTPAALEERNRFVRARSIEMIHGLPERTPLDAVIVRTHERDGYRIENLMFQSRPNFWVTASLYVPAAGKGPFPGIISPCGHSSQARLYPPYQYMYLGLVKEGFVVLAYDPIGQGERRYFWDPLTKRHQIGGPVTWEHSLPGQLLLLLGEDLTHYRIWDGMRAIDYLLTRPDVDPQRIGCCGQSGGGTLTLFISALDERVKCAAIHEGGTHHRWPVEIRPETRLGTGDTEQHFFPAGIYGIDLPDLHIAIAPRPLLATIEHFNPGFNQAAQDVKARYELLGAPEKFATVEAADPHDMTMKLRLANTDWFCRWFYNRRGPEVEPDFRLERAADMNCTAGGSVRYSGQGDTIYSLILKKQAALPPAQVIAKADLQNRIRSLIRYRKSDAPLDPRPVETTPRRGYHIEKLQFLSEPGIYINAWAFIPEKRSVDRSALLFIDEHGNEANGLEFGPLEQLTQAGNLVVSVEVRGIGETEPPHPDDSGRGLFGHVDDAETTMQYMAWELNESLFGMRVQDVVRSVDYALSREDVDRDRVRVIGKRRGALWAMFAAALDPRISHAICDHGLVSYRTLASSDRYLHAADIFIPDVLKYFDLPQVAAAIAPRRLAVVAPVDAMKSAVDEETARQEYQPAAEAYREAGAPDHFVVSCGPSGVSDAQHYLRYLQG